MSHIGTVREFVIENFLFGEKRDFSDDASFLETGIVDSTGILELVSFLEEKYRISVDDDEVVPENLDSIRNIDNFLSRKLDGKT